MRQLPRMVVLVSLPWLRGHCCRKLCFHSLVDPCMYAYSKLRDVSSMSTNRIDTPLMAPVPVWFPSRDDWSSTPEPSMLSKSLNRWERLPKMSKTRMRIRSGREISHQEARANTPRQKEAVPTIRSTSIC
mmetsp:Transcript_63043/g.70495  ORF Transcript_63043/g.70495 Transcript_63043/m.70495 type:complete len:130 (-) Transcript_63043:1237-1626(-)